MNNIIRSILIIGIWSAVMICGCGQSTAGQTSPATSKETGNEDSTTEGTSASASTTESAQGDIENDLLFLWKKDITLQDPFVPTQDLSSLPYKEISIPASEAKPIAISLDSLTLSSEMIDSSEGGVNAKYAVVKMDEAVQEEYAKVWSEFKKFNEFAEENAILEIAEGETRYKAYRKDASKASYLNLSSWTGIELKRTDTGLLSYFRTVYRYNRGFEPNYHELYGRTIDPATGRVLSLNDILTDTGELPQMIWDALVRSGHRNESDPDKEEFIEILRTAIQGCRDDGSFGWALDPLGIEFGLIESYTNGEATEHRRERAYIPFSRCREPLRPGIAEPSYDFMVQLAPEDVGELTGNAEIPFLTEKLYLYDHYYVQKSGAGYLYCSLEDHTDLCSITGQNIEKIGEIPAEISYDHYDHMCEVLSPDSFKLHRISNILQELFLEASAHSDGNGMVVRDGYYKLTTNPMPIISGREFEAELFEDAESTESVTGSIPANSMLTIVRSDGETFVDCQIEDTDQLARLYVEGDEENGFTVNGYPMDEVIGHQGWFEE